MIRKARMPSTNSKRNTACRSWAKFCRECDQQEVTEPKVVLYVAWMATKRYELSTCRQYLSAVLAFFSPVGVPASVEAFPRVRLALDGFKRMSQHRITFAVLRKLRPFVMSKRKEKVLWTLMVTATQGLFRLGN